jgi:ribonuclease HI
MQHKIYTDASYSKEAGGSIIGFLILFNDGEKYFFYDFLEKVKNTEAETIASDLAVKYCREKCVEKNLDCNMIVHTDCQKTVKNITPNVTYKKVIGHSKKSEKDEDDLLFNIVDKTTRKKLREIVKNKK